MRIENRMHLFAYAFVVSFALVRSRFFVEFSNVCCFLVVPKGPSSMCNVHPLTRKQMHVATQHWGRDAENIRQIRISITESNFSSVLFILCGISFIGLRFLCRRNRAIIIRCRYVDVQYGRLLRNRMLLVDGFSCCFPFRWICLKSIWIRNVYAVQIRARWQFRNDVNGCNVKLTDVGEFALYVFGQPFYTGKMSKKFKRRIWLNLDEIEFAENLLQNEFVVKRKSLADELRRVCQFRWEFYSNIELPHQMNFVEMVTSSAEMCVRRHDDDSLSVHFELDFI